MGLRAFLARPFAAYIVRKYAKAAANAEAFQLGWMQKLVAKANGTQFGKDHNFTGIKSYEDFKAAVPIRNYEALRPYIDRMVAGEVDVLWPGKPSYLAKTSGTTSGVKYIPLTTDSIPNHINSARDALLHYVHHSGKAQFLDRKLIFLSGSPVLESKNGINVGRLSGIVNHHVYAFLRSNQMPTWETNCIADWEQKLDKIVEETLPEDMSLISGIPPWVQMYFDKLKEKTGKKIKDIFPNFQLFVYGGVNFEPYRRKLMEVIGKEIDSIELFPASEGFFAFQDKPKRQGMQLMVDSGIFFEFVPADEYGKPNATRLHLGQVEKDKVYALIITNNAGLWAYSIGDLVRFVETKPHRLVVAGRTSHYISAFGEHVIAEEVEKAMKFTLVQFADTSVSEFSVAPQVTPEEGLPYHEWLIEFEKPPANLPAFERALDGYMQAQNIYYKDLIVGNILDQLHVRALPSGAFANMMRKEGKLGGQNKVPRLSNDRTLADKLC